MTIEEEILAAMKASKDPEAFAISFERELYKKSLYLMANDLLGFKDMTEQTHLEVCRALQAPTNRKLVCLPRGTLKSSIGCVAWPINLLANNPNLRILIDSEVYSNSSNFLREIKGHMKSPRFIKYFGDWEGPVWTEGELIISGRTIPKKEASITCSGIGAEKTGQHYDIIICDDLSSTKNTSSPDQQKKVIDHYRLYTSLLDPGGTMLVIGTRYAERDIIGFILQDELGFATLKELFKEQESWNTQTKIS